MWNGIWYLIAPELLVVVAACWVVGYALKKTPGVPNWSIVYIVTVIAIALVVYLQGWSAQSIIQGILAGAFAVFGHQFVKQGQGAANDTNA
ncbi:hypothetical protein EBB07_03540 [Paenibacillaceae bacterium]|nr:hypothetical protein EBB07_03540 [Paenibacillaceae bacterium]